MLKVEPAPRYLMTDAPLVQAVAQVNFPIVPKLQTVDGIAPLQDRLSGLLPYMNQQSVQQVELMVGPAGPAASSAQSTINVFTDDNGWELQISVQSATLSVNGKAYRGVADFRTRLETVWAALYDIAGVRRCDRLGVRYLDIVELNEPGWSTWFQPQIVGLADPDLSEGVLMSTLTETRLVTDSVDSMDSAGRVEGVIRHGLVPAGSVMRGIPPRPIQNSSFLFDMDIFVASPEPFQTDRLTAQFSQLHGQLESVFHWAVTDNGRKRFGYVLIEEKGETK